MDLLEDLASNLLVGVVERVFTKLARAVISPLLNKAKTVILKLAHSPCAKDYPDICGKQGELQFGALPPRDQWLERSLACRAPPVLDLEQIAKDAEIARREVLGTAQRMRRELPTLTRDLADEYLAAFGFDYSSWMARVRRTPASIRVHARGITRALRVWTADLRSTQRSRARNTPN